MILGANLLFTEKKRGGIPADCYEVEYLRGDGNSYINLGTPIPSGYWHKVKFKFTNTDTSYRAIIGARQASMVKDYQTTLSSGNLLIRYGTPTDQFWQRIAIDDVHTLELTSNMEVILDGVNLKTIGYSEPNPSINIYVMALNQNGSAIQIFGNGDYLYSIEVGSGSSKLYDLVPVRRVEGGVSVGYMCDKLTGQLYGNAGTGAFIVGPDKGAKTARDYIQNGLVAMWDGIENAGWGVHDDAATVWKDLIGGLQIPIPSNTDVYSWAEDELRRVGVKGLSATFPSIAVSDASMPYSFEFVLSAPVVPTVTASAYYFASWHVTNGRIFINNSNKLIFTPDAGWYYPTGGNAPFNRMSLSFAKSSNTMSGYSDRYSTELYTNGSRYVTGACRNPFNGSLYLFRASRDWAEETDIRFSSIRIYNRALTPAEIAANYAIDKARFGI